MDDLKKGMIFMKDLFQADNPLIRILECFFDLMELNFLFILTSLPLFTIGSSLCALYNTSIKMIRKEGISIHKNYMHCFRKQFKSATPLWICLFLLCAFFLTDLYIVSDSAVCVIFHYHLCVSAAFLL